MSLRRSTGPTRPLGQAAVYAVEGAARLILTGVMGVLIARHMGPSIFGTFNYALGVIGVAITVAMLGMRSVLVRDLATSDEWKPLLASAISLQLLAGIISGVAASLFIGVTRSLDTEILLLALTLAPLPVLTVGDTYRALLEVQGRARRIVVASLSATCLASAIKAYAIVSESPLWVFGSAWTIEAVILILVLGWGSIRGSSFRSLQRVAGFARTRALLRESWPLMLSTIAIALYVRVDIVMLGLLADDLEIGLYAAAARVSEIGYFIPVAAAAALRPHLARVLHSGDEEAYQRLTQRYLSGSFGVAIFGVVGALLLSDIIVEFLFGGSFVGSADILRVHILASPFIFVGVASMQWFVDRKLTREVMNRSIIGFVLNISLNLILIPRWGAIGASFGTLIAYGVSYVVANAFNPLTRPLLKLQLRSLRLASLLRAIPK